MSVPAASLSIFPIIPLGYWPEISTKVALNPANKRDLICSYWNEVLSSSTPQSSDFLSWIIFINTVDTKRLTRSINVCFCNIFNLMHILNIWTAWLQKQTIILQTEQNCVYFAPGVHAHCSGGQLGSVCFRDLWEPYSTNTPICTHGSKDIRQHGCKLRDAS